jgi:hypothetical protein
MTTTCGYVLPRRSQFEIERRILILSWTSLSKQKRAGAERGCTACPRFHDGDQPAKRRHQGRALHSASLERVLSASASIRSRRFFSSERCCSCMAASRASALARAACAIAASRSASALPFSASTSLSVIAADCTVSWEIGEGSASPNPSREMCYPSPRSKRHEVVPSPRGGALDLGRLLSAMVGLRP